MDFNLSTLDVEYLIDLIDDLDKFIDYKNYVDTGYIKERYLLIRKKLVDYMARVKFVDRLISNFDYVPISIYNQLKKESKDNLINHIKDLQIALLMLKKQRDF